MCLNNIWFFSENQYKILSKNTGKDLETIAQDTERDYFMDSIEAFDYGIVDKVLDNEKISE